MKRRQFVKKSTLGSLATIIGANVVFGESMPSGYVPLALQEPDPFKLFDLDSSMVVLNNRPWNIEAQAHLLDDNITPNSKMFIRNNGLIPGLTLRDSNGWPLGRGLLHGGALLLLSMSMALGPPPITHRSSITTKPMSWRSSRRLKSYSAV